MKISDKLLDFYRYLDYTPVASSITGLINLVVKKTLVNHATPPEILKNKYFTYIKNNSTERCALSMIPLLGNFAAYAYDKELKRYDDEEYFNRKNWSPIMFTKASFRLQNDREFVLSWLRRDPAVYDYIDPSMRDTPEFQEAMMRSVPQALHRLSREVLLRGLEDELVNFHFLGDHQKSDPAFIEAAVAPTMRSMESQAAACEDERGRLKLLEGIYASAPYILKSHWEAKINALWGRNVPNTEDPYWRNPLFRAKAIASHPNLILHCTPEQIKEFIQSQSYFLDFAARHADYASTPYMDFVTAHAPDEWYSFWNNMKSAHTACKRNPDLIRFVNPNLKDFNPFMLSLMGEHPHLLQNASEALKKDPEVVAAACSADLPALAYAAPSLKNDKEFMLARIAQKPDALAYASKELQKDPELVMAACAHGSRYLALGDPKFLTDTPFLERLARSYPNTWHISHAKNKAVALAFIKVNPMVFGELDDLLKMYLPFIKKAVIQNPQVIRFLPPLKMNKNTVLELMYVNPKIYPFLNPEFQSDPDIAQAYRDYGSGTTRLA